MRLIDADTLIADLDKGLWGEEWDKALAEAIINDAPTIDAVEVVRSDCNGCKFVGTYDTEFPCANCARKTKDYYEPQTERSE